VSETLFLEIYYDPTKGSYSYGLVDLTLPWSGDKRVFGWDDCPHEKIDKIRNLNSYPHHYQRRIGKKWVFEESPMRGKVVEEIDIVIEAVKKYLKL